MSGACSVAFRDSVAYREADRGRMHYGVSHESPATTSEIQLAEPIDVAPGSRLQGRGP